MNIRIYITVIFFFAAGFLPWSSSSGHGKKPRFKVLAFYTAKEDQAHISFVHEANTWFRETADKNHFSYDSTNDWSRLNADVLSQYQVVVFLDTRPDDSLQRLAFEKYMRGGGAWMGFHFAGFALTPSKYPQDWDWYHEQFLGAGQYVSNTWRPVPAILRVEDRNHPATKKMPVIFTSAASEWYRWKNDLRKNPAIDILLSIDSTSFPLGTGPKPHEIWHEGYYPVCWTNRNYRMIYFNFGHNDIDYEGHTNATLSYTFANGMTRKLVLESLLWLGSKAKAPSLP
jgi:uncharacterized protein